MSNTNYESLGLTKGASKLNVKQAYTRLHPNKGGNTAGFQSRQNAYERIMTSLEIMAAAEARNKAKNNGRRTNVSGAVGSAMANNVHDFFRRSGKKLPAFVRHVNNGNGKKLPAFVRHVNNGNGKNKTVVAPRNTSYSGLGVGRKNNTNPTPTTNAKPGFWSRFKRPSMPSFGFGGMFKSARQKAINARNFMPSNAFNGAKNGYEYKTNRHGRGYYRLGSFYSKNPIKGLPAMGPVAMGVPVPRKANNGGNNGPKNMITGNGNGVRGGGYGGGSVRVRTGNVRTGATRIGNVKSTSGSSRVEGVRGGSSQSEGGRGGSGGSISFAPVIKVSVPQAAAQSAVQALPAQERLALTNAGGYSSAAAVVSSAGGPATVQRAITALNANGGNVNAAMQKTGLSRQVFNNVNKLGGPVTARRALAAVKKVTVKTAPYVGQNATQRVYMGPNATRQNVYALAPVKKPRKKRRTEVKLAELNRVINAVKKKKLISLVAHNVTRTNIHANNGRLKPYYKRVIKAAILKRPFAKIARGHAKKLVVSAPAKKPRRKIPSTNNLSYV
jgi:hypothetical protein